MKGGCWRSWWGNKGQCETGGCWRSVGGGGGGVRGSVKGGWAGGAKGWVLDVLLRGG